MCENCEKLKAEINVLETRVEELEEELDHANGALEEIGEPLPFGDLD